MSGVSVELAEDQLRALRRYAAARRVPVSWLIRDYLEYLIRGGEPVTSAATVNPTPAEYAQVAEYGGAFDFLHDEPDLYTIDDGEPV